MTETPGVRRLVVRRDRGHEPCVVGTRLDMRMLVDPYSRSSTDQIAVNTISRWAFAVMDLAAVEIIGGAQP